MQFRNLSRSARQQLQRVQSLHYPPICRIWAMKKSLQHRMRRENMIFHSVIFRRQKTWAITAPQKYFRVENTMRSLQPILISLQITQTDLAIFLFYSVHSMKIQADGSGGVLRQPIKRHTVRCSCTHRIIWHQREYTTLFMYIPQMVR